MNDIADMDQWLLGEFEPTAVYFSDADCVEYLREETLCVHRRIDELLTLIYDETNAIPVGFKLKGFKHILDRMRERFDLSHEQFVELVAVLEAVCTDIGEELFSDSQRHSAYQAASKLAKNVKLYDFPLAA